MRARVWWTSLCLIATAVACGDQPTEVVPERELAVNPGDVAFATTTTDDGLSISTDKDDYQPGDVVQFTGYGWQPGDVLDIVLTDDPQTHDPHTWTVNVETDGTFHDSTYVVDEGDVNVSFTLVATSRATGRSLTVNFTDSQPQKITVTPAILSINQGGSASYSVNVQVGGNSTACTMKLSVQAATSLPAGTTFTFSGGDTITTNSGFNKTLTFNTLVTTPPSTINFFVQAARVANCQGNGVETSDPLTLNVLGPATKLAFTQQPPANTQAGNQFSTDVQVVDDAGHPIAAATSVTLAIANNSGTGTLSGTLTQATNASGLAAFTGLSINKAGSGYTLRATSSTGLTEVISNSFDITPGPATRLAFTTQPGGAAPNENLLSQPVVAVQDANGNTVTTGTAATAPIQLAILAGTGTANAVFTCTATTVNASAGVATFANCKIDLAGTNYQLRATNTVAGIAAVNSNTFNIVAANQAPNLNAIGDKSVAEETQLAFAATATDENVASLQFSLANPATGNFPTGAAISSAGAFTWTPTEAQGPGTYRVKIVVTDNATLTDEEEIAISVGEVNKAPQVTVIPDKSVNEDATLTFTASAADADLPANTLTFSLADGADPVPAGASINASSGVFTWTPTEAQGPGAYEFKVRATDNGTPGLFGETTVKVTVNEVNKAPVLGEIGNKSVDEGSTLTFTAHASDADVPANTLTFSLGGAPAGATINASTGVFSWTPADDDPTGTPSDDKTFKVVVKDNGTPQLSAEETITVTVNNVAPEANAGGTYNGYEGVAVSLNGSVSDPGADTFTWGWVYAPGQDVDPNASCKFYDPAHPALPGTATTSIEDPKLVCTDNGTVTLTLTVRDDDGGQDTDAATLTLQNVAPTATGLTTNGPVNEGSDIIFSVAGATDQSSVDAASLHYAFNCGSGYSASTYAAASPNNTFNCSTNDNGSRTVRGKVFDKDSGISDEESATVQVLNVPPTATFNAPPAVNEGDNIDLSLTNAQDVSSVDQAAGFTYAFDCGDGTGYAAFGTTANKSCSTSDNETRTVKSKIRDKDGGVSEYTKSVEVKNVPPTILTWGPLPATLIIGAGLNLTATFSDPGADTHTAKIDCGSGYGGASSVSSPYTYSCPAFGTVGDHFIKITIADDDGGSAEQIHKVTVVYNFSGFFAPVDRPNIMNLSKAGQAIPLKWRLSDAAGQPITNLTTVTVKTVNISCDASSASDLIEEYATTNTGLINHGDGSYQFNWKTPGNYAGTCKSIALVFGAAGGMGYTEKPSAYFTFKK